MPNNDDLVGKQNILKTTMVGLSGGIRVNSTGMVFIRQNLTSVDVRF